MLACRTQAAHNQVVHIAAAVGIQVAHIQAAFQAEPSEVGA